MITEIIAGKKVGNLYKRDISGFLVPIEFGVSMPIKDYKFLTTYNNFTLSAYCGPSDTSIPINENIGIEYNDDYISDLDGNNVKNAVIGPSTFIASKNIVQLRPIKVGNIISKYFSIPSSLNMSMNINDGIIIARQPINWYDLQIVEGYDQITTKCTIKTPKMANIGKHTNSLIYNIDEEFYIALPITDKDTIDFNTIYRFSFYYRTKSTTLTITPIIFFYTNQGSYINNMEYPQENIYADDNEDSDFRFFQIAIPKYGTNIPTNAKRMKIMLKMNTIDEISKFELIYPVIENSFNYTASVTPTHIFIPDAPSDYSFEEIYFSKLENTEIGTPVAFDSSKLFYSHIGRSLFNIKLEYSILDSVYYRQLIALQQLNIMGYDVVIRPKHPSLPPVLKGNLRVESSNISYDYRQSNVVINFTENQ